MMNPGKKFKTANDIPHYLTTAFLQAVNLYEKQKAFNSSVNFNTLVKFKPSMQNRCLLAWKLLLN